MHAAMFNMNEPARVATHVGSARASIAGGCMMTCLLAWCGGAVDAVVFACTAAADAAGLHLLYMLLLLLLLTLQLEIDMDLDYDD